MIIMLILLQSLNYGEGQIRGFDFDLIENGVADALLASGASPLVLHVLQFQYSGEMIQKGFLRGLQGKVQQTVLPLSTIDQVCVAI